MTAESYPTRRRIGLWLGLGALAMACALAEWWNAARKLEALTNSPAPDRPVRDAPNIKTPADIVERMVALAEIGPDDLVCDLGCGDGRLVIAAVARHGCNGLGLDNDPERLVEARAAAEGAGVADRIEFVEANILEHDFSAADAVLMYLLPKLNEALVPQLNNLKPGARIVSSEFEIKGLKAESIERIRSAANGEEYVLFLYRRPQPIGERGR